MQAILSTLAFFAKFAFAMSELTKSAAALYMIPVTMSDASPEDVLPRQVIDILPQLHYFIVENLRTARRFLRRVHRSIDIDSITFFELGKHTDMKDLPSFLEPLKRGEAIGVMSEAGCPGIADPGALAVAEAQRLGLKVVPLVGPSSILLSLMASGFNGQSFFFHGYLPIDSAARVKALKDMEADTLRHGTTHIFIETPYRNNRLIESLGSTLRPSTMVCVAAGITDPDKECILTLPASRWRNCSTDYSGIPTIFLIGTTTYK